MLVDDSNILAAGRRVEAMAFGQPTASPSKLPKKVHYAAI